MADYIKRTWVVENTWKCDSCGRDNLGRHMKCEGCGSPKEKQEKDNTSASTTAPAVTDPELLRLANQGANWVCEYCGGQVRNEHGKCVKNCGAPRADPPSSPAPPPDGKGAPCAFCGGFCGGRCPQGAPYVPQAAPKPARAAPRPLPTGVPGPGVSKPKAKPFKVPWWVVGAVLGGGGLIALLVWLLTSWEVEARVSGIEWTYTSNLRQRTTMHGEDWGSPSGAFNVSCQRKLYGTEDCHPHNCNAHSVSYECNCTSYECNCRTSCTDNKNGFSSCSETCSSCQRCSTCSRTEYDTCYDQCDVYKDWCSYDYYEWPIIATKETYGVTHDEHWADLKADGPLQRLDQHETYEVKFAGKEDAWKYRPGNLTEFQRFSTGATWKIQVNRLGMVHPVQVLP